MKRNLLAILALGVSLVSTGCIVADVPPDGYHRDRAEYDFHYGYGEGGHRRAPEPPKHRVEPPRPDKPHKGEPARPDKPHKVEPARPDKPHKVEPPRPDKPHKVEPGRFEPDRGKVQPSKDRQKAQPVKEKDRPKMQPSKDRPKAQPDRQQPSRQQPKMQPSKNQKPQSKPGKAVERDRKRLNNRESYAR